MDIELDIHNTKNKEKRIVEAIIAGKTPMQAVRAVGLTLSEQQANSLVSSIKQKNFSANGAMLQALERNNVTFDKIAKVYSKALDATKHVKVGQHEYLEVDDMGVQLAAAEKLNDIVPGMAAPKKIEVETHTFETKAQIIADLRDNPQAAIEVIQRMLLTRTQETN